MKLFNRQRKEPVVEEEIGAIEDVVEYSAPVLPGRIKPKTVLTVVWIASRSEKRNAKTFRAINKQSVDGNIRYILYLPVKEEQEELQEESQEIVPEETRGNVTEEPAETEEAESEEEIAKTWLEIMTEEYDCVTVSVRGRVDRAILLNHAMDYVAKDGYVTLVNSGQSFGAGYFRTMLGSLAAIGETETELSSAERETLRESPLFVMDESRKRLSFEGTFLRAGSFLAHRFREDLGLDSDREYFQRLMLAEKIRAGEGDRSAAAMNEPPVEIRYMDCRDGVLHLKGTLSALTDPAWLAIEKNHVSVPYARGEALTGPENGGRYAFTADIPLGNMNRQPVRFIQNGSYGRIALPLAFDTPFSKLSPVLGKAYWCFLSNGVRYMVRCDGQTIRISRVGERTRKKREEHLRKEMTARLYKPGADGRVPEVDPKDREAAEEIVRLRKQYFRDRREEQKQTIWLFFAKAENDPAAWMFRFAAGQEDGVKKLCVAEEGSSAWQELIREGIQPLAWGSFQHRLYLLHADLVIASDPALCDLRELPEEKSFGLRDLMTFRRLCLTDRGPAVAEDSVYRLLDGAPGAQEEQYERILAYSRKNFAPVTETWFQSFRWTVHRHAVEGDFFKLALRNGRFMPRFLRKPTRKLIAFLDRRLAERLRKREFAEEEIQSDKLFVMTYDNRYSCNARYVVEEILRRGLPIDIVWASPRNEKEDMGFPAGVRVVPRRSYAMFREQSTAKVWLDNALNCVWFGLPKKQGQIYLNTWHGSLGIKKLGGNKGWLRRAAQCKKVTDFCITNSGFEEDVFRTTYWPDTPFLKYGHARNDIFFDPERMEEKRRAVLETFGIHEGKKLFLYAPTFREEGMEGGDELDFAELQRALERRFGGSWVVLVRWHHKERKRMSGALVGTGAVDASDFGDMQELLPAIDAGMSDYSSWVYDFILTGRPIFLYAPDVEDYDQVRGFYYPLESTPFPIAYSPEEMVRKIEEFDEAEYRRKVEQFLVDKGCYEDGKAASRIVDAIERLIAGETVEASL